MSQKWGIAVPMLIVAACFATVHGEEPGPGQYEKRSPGMLFNIIFFADKPCINEFQKSINLFKILLPLGYCIHRTNNPGQQ